MDEFEEGFNSLPAGKTAAPAPADDTTAAPAPAPAPSVPPAPPEPKGQVEDDGVQPPAPAPAPASDEDDPAKLRQKLSTLQGILAKQGDELKQAREAAAKISVTPPAPPAPPASAPAPASEEDTDLISELEESSPVLAKAIKSMLKRERSELERELASKWGKSIEQVQQEMTPLKQTAEEVAIERHNSAIKKAHPDFDTVIETQDFKTWVDSQPSFVRKELQRIAQEGTASEVIETLTTFKKATSAAAPAPAPASQGNPAATRREQQLASSAAIPSRSAPVSTSGVPKGDFDAGFDEVAAQTQ